MEYDDLWKVYHDTPAEAFRACAEQVIEDIYLYNSPLPTLWEFIETPTGEIIDRIISDDYLQDVASDLRLTQDAVRDEVSQVVKDLKGA